jgi:hypothetical protein
MAEAPVVVVVRNGREYVHIWHPRVPSGAYIALAEYDPAKHRPWESSLGTGAGPVPEVTPAAELSNRAPAPDLKDVLLDSGLDVAVGAVTKDPAKLVEGVGQVVRAVAARTRKPPKTEDKE